MKLVESGKRKVESEKKFIVYGLVFKVKKTDFTNLKRKTKNGFFLPVLPKFQQQTINNKP